jgi:MFS family permease
MTGLDGGRQLTESPKGQPPEVHSAADQRRLVLVVGAVVFLDTLFYTVVAPLLPGLSHELHLSKSAAGVLTGAYAAGSLVMAIPGGLVASRFGPRFAVSAGVAMMVVSTLGFAWLNTAAGLDIARFIEGVGGAWAWAGGLAWIVTDSPAHRRGEMIGKVLAAAVSGALFGPVIGAVAAAAGRPATFTAVAVFGIVLLVVTSRAPHSSRRSDEGIAMLLLALRRPAFRLAMWMMFVPAVVSGLLNLLAPLRLSQFGAGATLIGIVYVIAAGAEAFVSPRIGKLSDRHGRVRTLRISMGLIVIVLMIFTLPRSVAAVSVMVVVSMVTLGTFWAPSMALVSDVAQSYGIEQAIAGAVTDLGWAGGQLLGAVLGGAAAKAAGDAVPMSCAAGICVVTLLLLIWPRVSGTLEQAQRSASGFGDSDERLPAYRER